jgi:hypothetical protein
LFLNLGDFVLTDRPPIAAGSKHTLLVKCTATEFLARYAKHNANFVLVVSGSLEAQRTKKFIEIFYDLLIKTIELRSFALLKFGVRSEGLK